MAAATMIERIRRFPSPRIRAQLAAAGIHPSAFETADLSRLAPLRPAALDLDVLADPVGELRLGDAPSPIRLGTSDRPNQTIVLSWTARDLERIARSGAAMLARAGVKPGMKVANTLEGGFTTPGSLILGDAAEALGVLDVPVGPVREEKNAGPILDLLDRIEADVLVADAAGAKGLLPALTEGFPRSVSGIVWTGAHPPRPVVSYWQRRWLSVPEVAIFAAIECGRGRFHLGEDVLVEAEGRSLLFTTFAGDAPVLRLESEIRGEICDDVCSCGDRGRTLRIDRAETTVRI